MDPAPPLNADDLATALTNGAAGWLVLSVAAVLPMIWTFTLVLHFARPTIMRFLQSLTLRFGGDVWWLSYVLFRDALLVITLIARDPTTVVPILALVYLLGFDRKSVV